MTLNPLQIGLFVLWGGLIASLDGVDKLNSILQSTCLNKGVSSVNICVDGEHGFRKSTFSQHFVKCLDLLQSR